MLNGLDTDLDCIWDKLLDTCVQELSTSELEELWTKPDTISNAVSLQLDSPALKLMWRQLERELTEKHIPLLNDPGHIAEDHPHILEHPVLDLKDTFKTEQFVQALRARAKPAYDERKMLEGVKLAKREAAKEAAEQRMQKLVEKMAWRPLVLWDVENVMDERLCTKCFALCVMSAIERSTGFQRGKYDLMSVCSVTHFDIATKFRGGLVGLSEAGVMPLVCKQKKEQADHELINLMNKHQRGHVAVISDDKDLWKALQTFCSSASSDYKRRIFLFCKNQVAAAKQILEPYGIEVHELICAGFPCTDYTIKKSESLPDFIGKAQASHSGFSPVKKGFPKSSAQVENRVKGRVVKVHDNGYGFFRTSSNDKDVFFHFSDLPPCCDPRLNQVFTFCVKTTAKGIQATSIRLE
jgi:cold shock CspA family protein